MSGESTDTATATASAPPPAPFLPAGAGISERIPCAPELAAAGAAQLMALAQRRLPCIEEIVSATATEGGLLVVRAAVEGTPLRAVVDSGSLNLWQRFYVIDLTLAAVAQAHSAGALHGTLCADNILLSPGPDGNAVLRLSGFGRAFAGGAALGGDVLLCAAPEVLARLTFSQQADVYAAGCLAYYILSGHQPYSAPGADAQAWYEGKCADRCEPLNAQRPDIAPLMCEWVHWLMRGEAFSRPRDAMEALQVLRDIRSGAINSLPNWVSDSAAAAAALAQTAAAMAAPIASPAGADSKKRKKMTNHELDGSMRKLILTLLFVGGALAGLSMGVSRLSKMISDEVVLPEQKEPAPPEKTQEILPPETHVTVDLATAAQRVAAEFVRQSRMLDDPSAASTLPAAAPGKIKIPFAQLLFDPAGDASPEAADPKSPITAGEMTLAGKIASLACEEAGAAVEWQDSYRPVLKSLRLLLSEAEMSPADASRSVDLLVKAARIKPKVFLRLPPEWMVREDADRDGLPDFAKASRWQVPGCTVLMSAFQPDLWLNAGFGVSGSDRRAMLCAEESPACWQDCLSARKSGSTNWFGGRIEAESAGSPGASLLRQARHGMARMNSALELPPGNSLTVCSGSPLSVRNARDKLSPCQWHGALTWFLVVRGEPGAGGRTLIQMEDEEARQWHRVRLEENRLIAESLDASGNVVEPAAVAFAHSGQYFVVLGQLQEEGRLHRVTAMRATGDPLTVQSHAPGSGEDRLENTIIRLGTNAAGSGATGASGEPSPACLEIAEFAIFNSELPAPAASALQQFLRNRSFSQ